MNYVNLSRIYSEMITRYHATSFGVSSVLDKSLSKPSETIIEFYYDKQVPVDIPRLRLFLKRHIRFVDDFVVYVEEGSIMICILFRTNKKKPLDFGFEFSLN